MALRLLIDTDPATGVAGADIDDGIALGLAFRSPGVTVEAITVVEGNVPLATGLDVALGLVELAGAARSTPPPPVHRGAGRPFREDPDPWRHRLDHWGTGPDVAGWWDGIEPYRATTVAPAAADAAGAIIDAVRRHPGELTIVAIGPLTNVATALERVPEIAPLIARLVVMGGAFEVYGSLQEFNMGFDPEAAHIVMTAGIPTLLVPLDVTLQTSLPLSLAERLAAVADDPLVAHLGRTAVPYIRLVEARGRRQGCPLHDPLAMAATLEGTGGLLTTVQRRVDVELGGSLTRGRPVAWPPSGGVMAPGLTLPDVAPIEVATGVNNDRLLEILERRLLGAGA